MKYLITGGSGFIGTNVIQRLLDLGEIVLNVDLETPQNKDHIEFFKFCDIREFQSLSLVINKFQPDYIIHLAARTDLAGTELLDYDTNIKGVDNLCKAVTRCDSIKKIFFTSSMLVCSGGYEPKTVEDFSPTTVYGESKVIGETIVRSYSDLLPDYLIARPTSIWGPWFRTPYKDFFDIVLSGKFIDAGPKLATKTYGFIDNVTNQIISLTTSENCFKDELIYLGDEKPIEIRRWASDIRKKMNKSKPLRVPFISLQLLAILGDVLSHLNISFPMTTFRLKNMTTSNILSCHIASANNRFPSHSYEQSLIKTINWLKNKGVK